MDHFCPNCARFLGTEPVPQCPGCGHTIFELPGSGSPANGGLPELVPVCPPTESGPAYKCPFCSHMLTPLKNNVLSFELLGKEIPVGSVQALRVNLLKKTITQVIVEFDGWYCGTGHKFYRSARETVKEICPVCRGALVRFGTSVISCRRCKLSMTKDQMAYLKADDLLKDEGWTHWPQPLPCMDDPPRSEPAV